MSSARLGRYSLAGPENRAAVDAGLANGAWYRSPIPRKRMKELMRRSDMPAVRDTNAVPWPASCQRESDAEP